MKAELKSYLEDLYRSLKLEPGQRREFIQEIYIHLKEKIEELLQKGVSEEEAQKQAINSLGLPQIIAQKINEVYNSGSWREAFLGALPHFLCSLLFAFKLWTNIFWLLGLSLFTLGTSLYGWCRGRPIWLFPWLGYSLLPFIGLGYLLFALPPWSYLGFLVYLPLVWKLFSLVVGQTIRRDWLYLSLSLLPFPVLSLGILGWQTFKGEEFYFTLASLSPWFSLSFFVLGVVVISFIRSSYRPIKTGALLTPEIILMVILALATKVVTDVLVLWLLLLITVAVLLSPAFLQGRLFKEEARLEEWLR